MKKELLELLLLTISSSNSFSSWTNQLDFPSTSYCLGRAKLAQFYYVESVLALTWYAIFGTVESEYSQREWRYFDGTR